MVKTEPRRDAFVSETTGDTRRVEASSYFCTNTEQHEEPAATAADAAEASLKYSHPAGCPPAGTEPACLWTGSGKTCLWETPRRDASVSLLRFLFIFFFTPVAERKLAAVSGRVVAFPVHHTLLVDDRLKHNNAQLQRQRTGRLLIGRSKTRLTADWTFQNQPDC